MARSLVCSTVSCTVLLVGALSSGCSAASSDAVTDRTSEGVTTSSVGVVEAAYGWDPAAGYRDVIEQENYDCLATLEDDAHTTFHFPLNRVLSATSNGQIVDGSSTYLTSSSALRDLATPPSGEDAARDTIAAVTTKLYGGALYISDTGESSYLSSNNPGIRGIEANVGAVTSTSAILVHLPPLDEMAPVDQQQPFELGERSGEWMTVATHVSVGTNRDDGTPQLQFAGTFDHFAWVPQTKKVPAHAVDQGSTPFSGSCTEVLQIENTSAPGAVVATDATDATK